MDFYDTLNKRTVDGAQYLSKSTQLFSTSDNLQSVNIVISKELMCFSKFLGRFLEKTVTFDDIIIIGKKLRQCSIGSLSIN